VSNGILGKQALLVSGENVQELRQWTVAVGHPVRPAINTRENLVGSFRRRVVAGDELRAPFVIETARPSLTDEGLGEKEFASVPIEEVEESISIGRCDHLSLPAAKLDIDQDGILRRVPIVQIVWRELEVPL